MFTKSPNFENSTKYTTPICGLDVALYVRIIVPCIEKTSSFQPYFNMSFHWKSHGIIVMELIS